jgi:hemoglobin-like flavoprotein
VEPEASQGPLGAQEVELVQSTWTMVAPIADAAATLFYDKLFALDPSLRTLFPADLTEQKKKLMATIGFAVGALKKPEALLPAVQDLGRRHAGYGVVEAHYATVGSALLDTLAAGLGDAFTPEAKAAWTKTYTVLSSTMIEAAREAAA